MVTEVDLSKKKLHCSSEVFSLFTGPLGMVDRRIPLRSADAAL